MEDLPIGWVKIQSRGVCGFRSIQDLKGENSEFVLVDHFNDIFYLLYHVVSEIWIDFMD